MKLTPIIKLCTIAGLTLGAVSSASADIKESARKVFTDKQSSVVGVKGIMKIDVKMNGQVAQSQEAPITSMGLTIDNGLVLVAYRSINPDVAANAPKNPAIKIDTNLEELKLVDGSGDEFDAKIILHDEALGLAFLALDPKGENAKDFKSAKTDISKDIDLKHLDDVVYLSRFGANLRYTPAVTTGTVAAIIEKPRKNFIATGARPGSPVFSATGDFVGLTVVKADKGSKQQTPIILPAKYVRKLVAQAKEKQAELAK